MKMSLSVFADRVKNMNLDTMKTVVDEIHRESKVSKSEIITDMIWCAFRYGVGYLEYRLFGWVYVKGKKRKEFMVMKSSLEIYTRLNQREYLDIFEDKAKFLKRFSKYAGRDFLDISEGDFEDFKKFFQKQKSIIVKPKDLSGGNGIRKIDISEYDSDEKIGKLYEELTSERLYVVEECLKQHEGMSKFASSSINTLRMVTVVDKNKKAHLMYTIIRIGDGKQVVDNASSGGVYTMVDENGVMIGKAFLQKDGTLYEKHPYTKAQIKGETVPCFQECIQLVKKAALEVEQIRYVGWDVAVTPEGPVLVEGNVFPGYDMPQNYYLCDGNNGILKKFLDVIDG